MKQFPYKEFFYSLPKPLRCLGAIAAILLLADLVFVMFFRSIPLTDNDSLYAMPLRLFIFVTAGIFFYRFRQFAKRTSFFDSATYRSMPKGLRILACISLLLCALLLLVVWFLNPLLDIPGDVLLLFLLPTLTCIVALALLISIKRLAIEAKNTRK